MTRFPFQKYSAILALLLFLLPGLHSQNIPRPNIFAPKATGVEVNSYTGGIHYSKTLFQLPARGLDIELGLFYNSAHDTLDWGFGRGWTHTYNQRYWTEGADLVFLRADGRTDRFILENGAFQAPAGIFDTLMNTGPEQYLLRSKYGEKYFFENGLLTRIEDRNNNALTLEYQGEHLDKVKDATGLRWLSFSWSGDFCTAVSDLFDPGDPRTYALEYSGGDLQSITDPLDGKTLFAYDQHLLERITDENSNETSIEYNEGGAATMVASCLTRQNITYNIAGRRTYVGELVGNTNQITTYEYDSLGRNTSRKGNCCGYDLTYTYDDDLNVSTMVDGNGNLRQYEFDWRGNVTKETDPNGDFEIFTYTQHSLVNSYTDKKGIAYSYGHDGNGNMLDVQKPMQILETYEYDAMGQNKSFSDGNGEVTQYFHDTHGNLKSILYPTLDSMVFTYDLRGNRLSETDGNGNTTYYLFDKLNRVLEETDALNYKTTYTYDPRGNRILMVNAKGDSTFYKYDGLDRITEIRAPMGLVTRYTYDSRGNLVRVIDPRGAVTQYEYNERNLPVTMTDPLGKITQYTYDGNGNRTSVTDPNGNTVEYQFDKLDRVLKMTDALGNASSYEYDLNGNLFKTTDANGKITQYGFDDLNRQVIMTDALGNATEYQYDGADNLIQIIDANGNVTSYDYDGSNRVVRETFADTKTKEYEYDGAGNVVRRKDNLGVFTDYEYDELHRLVKRDYPGSNDDTFGYDPLGQMTHAQNASSTLDFEYDDAGRLLSETLNGKTTSYSYNTAHGKRTLTYPSGRIVEEFFDKRNQLAQVKADGALVASWAYDPAGRMKDKTYGNGVKASYGYDAADRVEDLVYKKGMAELVHFAYAFDKVGNKLYERKLHHDTHSEWYGYDDIYRMIDFKMGHVSANGNFSNPVTQTHYDYDALGNRNFVETDGQTTNYAANEMNEYISISGAQNASPTHDDNGNLTWDGEHSYAYDYENRLISVDNGATASYFYDALGRRIRKEVGGLVTQYFFDGFREIEERDGNDNVAATYVFGTWIDDVLQMKRAGNLYFYHPNSLGSVAALSNAAGEVVERYEYEGYGEVHFLDAGFGELSGSGVGNEVLFTGRRLDGESSTLFFRSRVFSFNDGNFFQRDQIGYEEGLNLYRGYFIPNKIDPLGLSSCFPYCEKTEDCFKVCRNPNLSPEIRSKCYNLCLSGSDVYRECKTTCDQYKLACDLLVCAKFSIPGCNKLSSRKEAGNILCWVLDNKVCDDTVGQLCKYLENLCYEQCLPCYPKPLDFFNL